MNITQIKYVLEISQSSSMREAATKLFVSQPALSLSIKELEEEYYSTSHRRGSKNRQLVFFTGGR